MTITALEIGFSQGVGRDLPVLHYDHDFDLIAGVTGQDCRWVVPRGTVP